MKSVIDAWRYLNNNNISVITRPFALRERAIRLPNKWIWSGFSPENEIHNISQILLQSVTEYEAFIKRNRIKLETSPYLDPDKSIIYEYEPVFSRPLHTPILHEHQINNNDHYLPKLSLRIINNDNKKIDDKNFPILTINGREYHSTSSSHGSAVFLFHETPMLNMLYRMLHEDVEKQYKIHTRIII